MKVINSLGWLATGSAAFWIGGFLVRHFNPKIDKSRWL